MTANAMALRMKRWIVRATRRPAVGGVDFGSLRRTEPISGNWGFDRGLPVDRFFVERFLERRAEDVRGRVLEIGDDSYTRRFGGDRVSQSDILDNAPDNPRATFVADLTRGETIPSDSFDCIICTQTLHVIPDVEAAIRTLYRILRPGGVLLATVPGISRIYRNERYGWADYWRFTTFSAEWLFGRVFPAGALDVAAHGNVLSAVAFLHGVAAEELSAEELERRDPAFQMLITVRAVKPTTP